MKRGDPVARSYPLPSGSLWPSPPRQAARPSFKRSNFAQALFDIFAAGFLAAFASLLGLSILICFAVLFFNWP